MGEEIRFRERPSDRSMLTWFLLTMVFVLTVEMLLLYGLRAWWGEDADGWSAVVAFGVMLVLMFVCGHGLDARQHRDMWQVEDD